MHDLRLSFSIVFQSYQDDWGMIMKGCVQWNPFTVKKISPREELEPGIVRSVGQLLTHGATRTPTL